MPPDHRYDDDHDSPERLHRGSNEHVDADGELAPCPEVPADPEQAEDYYRRCAAWLDSRVGRVDDTEEADVDEPHPTTPAPTVRATGHDGPDETNSLSPLDAGLELSHHTLPQLSSAATSYDQWAAPALTTPSLVRLVNHLEQAIELCTSTREAHEMKQDRNRERFFGALSVSSVGALVAITSRVVRDPKNLELGLIGIILLPILFAVLSSIAAAMSTVEAGRDVTAEREREAQLRQKLVEYKSELQIRQMR